MDWETLVKIGHIVGTVLGVGGATFAEIYYMRREQGPFLGTIYWVLRLGTVILVLSGFGFLVLSRLEGATAHLYSPRLWSKMIITLIIVVNAFLMQTRKISPKIGAAISLTSWYAALVIGSWRFRASLWEIMAVYAALIIVVGIVQEFIRKRLEAKT